MKLDDTMLMYGIYNAEALGKLINTVQEIHNVTSSHERLFAGNATLYFLCNLTIFSKTEQKFLL